MKILKRWLLPQPVEWIFASKFFFLIHILKRYLSAYGSLPTTPNKGKGEN